jgi:hypothetical protein
MIGTFERDEWKMEEYCGDRLMGTIAANLFNKYRLPSSWSGTLISALCSNDYQKLVASKQGLDLLIHSTVGKKTSSALEVPSLLLY